MKQKQDVSMTALEQAILQQVAQQLGLTMEQAATHLVRECLMLRLRTSTESPDCGPSEPPVLH